MHQYFSVFPTKILENAIQNEDFKWTRGYRTLKNANLAYKLQFFSQKHQFLGNSDIFDLELSFPLKSPIFSVSPPIDIHQRRRPAHSHSSTDTPTSRSIGRGRSLLSTEKSNEEDDVIVITDEKTRTSRRRRRSLRGSTQSTEENSFRIEDGNGNGQS